MKNPKLLLGLTLVERLSIHNSLNEMFGGVFRQDEFQLHFNHGGRAGGGATLSMSGPCSMSPLLRCSGPIPNSQTRWRTPATGDAVKQRKVSSRAKCAFGGSRGKNSGTEGAWWDHGERLWDDLKEILPHHPTSPEGEAAHHRGIAKSFQALLNSRQRKCRGVQVKVSQVAGKLQ